MAPELSEVNLCEAWDETGDPPDSAESSTPTVRTQADESADQLRLIVQPGWWVELRALNVGGPGRTFSGWFDHDHLRDLARHALSLTRQASGVYFTINPVKPAVASKRMNTVLNVPKEFPLTHDSDIDQRPYFLVDVDRVRPTDEPSTDEELAHVRRVADDQIVPFLAHLGFSHPVVLCSGNGIHLIYRVRFGPTRRALDPAKALLALLAERFDCAEVKIDTNTSNPARMTKVPGTRARKGTESPGRPHRLVKIEGYDDTTTDPARTVDEILDELQPGWDRVVSSPAPSSPPSCRRDTNPDKVHKRAVAWLATMDPSIQGQDGSGKLMAAARCMCWGFLGREAGYRVILDHFNPRCVPPWSEAEIAHACDSAMVGADEPQFWLRDQEQDQPARSRSPHPTTRPNTPSAGPPDPAGGPEPDRVGQERGSAGSPTAGRRTHPREKDTNSHRLARLFMESIHYRNQRTIVYWRQEYYRFRDGGYSRLSDSELRAELTVFIRWQFERDHASQVARHQASEEGEKGAAPPAIEDVTKLLVTNVMQALSGAARLPAERSPPCWVDRPETDPGHLIATPNALARLEDLPARSLESISAATPRFFTLTSIPVRINLAAPEPRAWLKFLNSCWPDDPDSIQLLREWFGYVLSGETRLQKFLFIQGPTRSGKGVIADTLKNLIGENNIASVTFEDLVQPFGLADLLGKSLTIMPDLRISPQGNIVAGVQRMLTIVGEDPVPVNRKQKDLMSVAIGCRFLITSNETPRLPDASGAAVARMLSLQMKISWLNCEDTKLKSKISPELPSILLWAADGYQSLTKRGFFKQPTTGRQLINDAIELASPIQMFAADRCTIDPDAKIVTTDLYKEWKSWCEENGRKEPGTIQTFSANLRAAFAGITTRQIRTITGRTRQFEGIRLATANDDDETGMPFEQDL